jgi:hypothetical protein
MEYNAKALNFVQIAYIHQDEFMNLLKQFPEDHYRYCHYKD